MIPTPNGHYILIRTSRQEEIERKERKGSIYLPSSQIFMTRNLQHGEVVSIGEKAHKYFPEVKVGHTLLVHHFVQAENEQAAKDEHLVHQDEKYNYYVVSVYQIAGKTAEAYAAWDGEKLIPNPYYIFLEFDPPVSMDMDIDTMIAKSMQISKSGILTFNQWHETREDKEAKMAQLKMEIDGLSKSGVNKSHIKEAIQEKEQKLERLSAEINGKYFGAFTVAAFHESLNESFQNKMKVGSVVYVWTIAAQTTIEFFGKEYRVVKADDKYIGCLIPD